MKNYGDITKINAEELPDFDCLVGGFPCQAFSIAGKRRGFEDTRGTLFFELARILREKQPRYFVFENVKGLLSHDNGNTFRTIITTIDELGYDCQWSVLNSKDFGVPQNRERIIIVGHLRGAPRPEVFPIGGSDIQTSAHEQNEQRGAQEYIATRHLGRNGSLTSPISGSVQASEIPHIKIVGGASRKDRYYDATGISPTLDGGRGGLRQSPKIVDNVIGTVNRGEFKPTGESSLTITATYGKGHDNHGARPMVLESGTRIRRLTPLECERLQAFPDNWTQYGRDGQAVSDTQRYKMCGNAVTTNVIQAVVERLVA